jgi:hypothetical protein
MNSKTTPVVLVMFTLVFALPAAGAIPAAIAQEEDASLGAGLARSLVPDVLDGGGDDEEENGDAVDDEIDQDSTGTATVNPNQEYNNEANFAPQNNNPVAIPIIDQDQGAANLAAQLAANLDLDAANVDVNEEEEVPPECPEGFAPENGQCRSTETTEPTCPEGFAPENGQCRSILTTVDRECPDGFEFETREGGEVVCESTATAAEECPDGFEAETVGTEEVCGSTETTVDRECPDGFEAETVGTEEVCGSTETTVDRECPDGFEAETVGTEEVCGSTETTVDRECPDGFAFDTVNGEQVCRSTATTEPTCPEGFAPENGQCRSTETTEPT